MVGCCGILECQASNDHVFVADNVKFSVVTMDRDGKAISKFGRRGREEQFFAGCCNPSTFIARQPRFLPQKRKA